MSNAVLFLCEGNSCRSQMAEAYLRKHAGQRFDVHSAGVAATAIHPFTYRVMNEVGIDLSEHRSKSVREYFRSDLSPGYVIIVCNIAESECPQNLSGGLGTHPLAVSRPGQGRRLRGRAA